MGEWLPPEIPPPVWRVTMTGPQALMGRRAAVRQAWGARAPLSGSNGEGAQWKKRRGSRLLTACRVRPTHLGPIGDSAPTVSTQGDGNHIQKMTFSASIAPPAYQELCECGAQTENVDWLP
jgi:hypothetical protein